jgi:uncharacterized protein (TIGR00290 family)
MPASTLRYAVSWSGGKDSALALARAWRTLGPPAALLTMMIEDGSRSRSHGLRPELIDLQAALLGTRALRRSTSWADYERDFATELAKLRERGVTAIVFGDIDLQAHRDWCLKVCAATGLAAIHPLWHEARTDLFAELRALDIGATIVAIKDKALPLATLGMDLRYAATREAIEASGADLCGENGEYHTVVTSMPQFRAPIALTLGTPLLRDGYWFVDAAIE